MLSAYQGPSCLVLELGTYISMMLCVAGMRKISLNVVIEELASTTVDIMKMLVFFANVSIMDVYP